MAFDRYMNFATLAFSLCCKIHTTGSEETLFSLSKESSSWINFLIKSFYEQWKWLILEGMRLKECLNDSDLETGRLADFTGFNFGFD